MKVTLDQIEIKVQPELAEAVMKQKLSKEYFCWLIIKSLDKTMSNSSGKINKKKMIKKIIEITDLSRHTISRYLKNGDGIFWRFNTDYSTLYLNSFTKVCLSIGLSNIYSYNIIYNLSMIGKNFGSYSKSLLMAAIASKTGKPVSNIGLADRCGVCKRTVQNYLSNSINCLDVVHKIENFVLLSVNYSFQEAKNLIPYFIKNNKIHLGSIRIRQYKDEYWLLKQIPNSFINKTGRIKIKAEKRKLKKILGYSNITKNKKIYYDSGIDSGDGLEYICTLTDDGKSLYYNDIPNINIFIKRGE